MKSLQVRISAHGAEARIQKHMMDIDLASLTLNESLMLYSQRGHPVATSFSVQQQQSFFLVGNISSGRIILSVGLKTQGMEHETQSTSEAFGNVIRFLNLIMIN